MDECISEIGDYTESEAHIDPRDEKSVMSTCINTLYTLIQSSHKTRYIDNVHKLSCLFYQIVSINIIIIVANIILLIFFRLVSSDYQVI